MFLAALLLFIAGSALCGAAQSIGQLVAFRVLQGVGGGMLTPVGVAMLFRAFPPAERARASTLMMIPTLARPPSGPSSVVSSSTHVGWRWIFYVNVPFGLLALVFGFRFLREHREPSAGGFDRPGFVLSGGGLAAGGLRLERRTPCRLVASVGWSLGVVGRGGVWRALVGSSSRVAEPMLDLRLLRDRMFRATNVVSLFSTASFLGLIFLLPALPAEPARVERAGVRAHHVPAGVRHDDLLPARRAALPADRAAAADGGGLGWAALTIATFACIGLDTNLWWIRVLIFVRGLGMGFAFVPIQAASYARIRRPTTAGPRRSSPPSGRWRRRSASPLSRRCSPASPPWAGRHDPHRALTDSTWRSWSPPPSPRWPPLAWFLVHDEDAAIQRGESAFTPERVEHVVGQLRAADQEVR